MELFYNLNCRFCTKKNGLEFVNIKLSSTTLQSQITFRAYRIYYSVIITLFEAKMEIKENRFQETILLWQEMKTAVNYVLEKHLTI